MLCVLSDIDLWFPPAALFFLFHVKKSTLRPHSVFSFSGVLIVDRASMFNKTLLDDTHTVKHHKFRVL